MMMIKRMPENTITQGELQRMIWLNHSSTEENVLVDERENFRFVPESRVKRDLQALAEFALDYKQHEYNHKQVITPVFTDTSFLVRYRSFSLR